MDDDALTSSKYSAGQKRAPTRRRRERHGRGRGRRGTLPNRKPRPAGTRPARLFATLCFTTPAAKGWPTTSISAAIIRRSADAASSPALPRSAPARPVGDLPPSATISARSHHAARRSSAPSSWLRAPAAAVPWSPRRPSRRDQLDQARHRRADRIGAGRILRALERVGHGEGEAMRSPQSADMARPMPTAALVGAIAIGRSRPASRTSARPSRERTAAAIVSSPWPSSTCAAADGNAHSRRVGPGSPGAGPRSLSRRGERRQRHVRSSGAGAVSASGLRSIRPVSTSPAAKSGSRAKRRQEGDVGRRAGDLGLLQRVAQGGSAWRDRAPCTISLAIIGS